MASIDRTVYPQICKHLNTHELTTHYRLSQQENDFVRQSARGATGRLSVVALLKTRQFLNYFPTLNDIPDQARHYLIEQIASIWKQFFSTKNFTQRPYIVTA